MAKKLIAKFKKNWNGDVLMVYENKQGLRGTVLDKDGKVTMSTMFYHKDNDATVYRVREYFGFKGSTGIDRIEKPTK